jgi:hypothetical protein
MPELTFGFDAPLEANRISSEDTQAQLDESRQMLWIKPDYKAVTLEDGMFPSLGLRSFTKPSPVGYVTMFNK